MIRILIIVFGGFFGSLALAGSCMPDPTSPTICTDTTPCKTLANGSIACLNGVSAPTGTLSLSATCWNYQSSYICQTPNAYDGCSTYENNPACAMIYSVCTDKLAETGQCDAWNYTYQCQTSAAQTSAQLVCSSTSLFDTSALTTPSNPNNTLMTAAVAMEMARESQIYGGGLYLFAGVSENCTKGYYGLKNCCRSDPGAQSDSSILQTIAGNAAWSAAKYVGSSAVDLASPYVFDAMFSSGLYTAGMLDTFVSSTSVVSTSTGIATNFAANGITLGAYGFTYGTGSYAAYAASSTTLPGTMALYGETGTSGFVAFNPYVFIAIVAINAIQQAIQCTPAEDLLAIHKGAGLSSYNDEKCTNTFFGSCLEYTDNYCSFNSVLAKIINVQGKQQLGLNVKDCMGLSVQQVSSLNFTTIDFSEFIGQMKQIALSSLPNNIKGNYTPVMQSTNKGSTQSPASGLTYPAGTIP